MTAIPTRDAHHGLGADEVHLCVPWGVHDGLAAGRRAALVRLDNGVPAYATGSVGGLADERGLVPVSGLLPCSCQARSVPGYASLPSSLDMTLSISNAFPHDSCSFFYANAPSSLPIPVVILVPKLESLAIAWLVLPFCVYYYNSFALRRKSSTDIGSPAREFPFLSRFAQVPGRPPSWPASLSQGPNLCSCPDRRSVPAPAALAYSVSADRFPSFSQCARPGPHQTALRFCPEFIHAVLRLYRP
jgi:hypothetical protein